MGTHIRFAGRVVADVRAALDLTQPQFGELLGMSRESVSMWERYGVSVVQLRAVAGVCCALGRHELAAELLPEEFRPGQMHTSRL